MSKIVYPCVPVGRTYEYVPMSNLWMRRAMETAHRESLDKAMPVGVVITAPDGALVEVGGARVVMAHGAGQGFISAGANGSTYHDTHGCERKRRGSKSGQDYDLCDGCNPKNHGEAKAVAAAKAVGIVDLRGYHMYLWGHWYCCKDCCNVVESNGIARIFLLEGSERLFNNTHAEHVIGRQYEVCAAL